MRKRLLSALLALCLLLGLFPGAVYAAGGAQPFTDVNEADWFSDAVQYVYQNGLMYGTDDTAFSPDSSITRGQIAAILYRMEGSPASAKIFFTDVPAGEYYTDAAAWASVNGIMNGYGDGRFGPADPITREQLASTMYRYAGHKGYDTTITGSIARFSDGAAVSSYAVDAVNWAIGAGLFSGVGDNMFAPASGSTRAQAARILMLFCENTASSGKDTAPAYHTVTFDYNYGSKGTYDTATVEHGKAVARPKNPTRDGYSFAGWYTEKSGGKVHAFTSGITADLTLYAHWTSDNGGSGGGTSGGGAPSVTYYTVTFDANGGTASSSYVRVASGSAIGALPTADKAGCVFLGWYTEASGGTQITASTRVTGNITVYARWSSIGLGSGAYQVTFEMNDGSGDVYEIQWLDAGETASEPEDPARNLYRFTGWYSEAAAVTEYDFSTPVESDLTLYAGWGNPDGSTDSMYAASDETETIYSISGIEVRGGNVIVTYNTNEAARLDVEFFSDEMTDGGWSDENLEKNLSLSPIAAASGYTERYGELATVTLPITGALPEYYLVRASMYGASSGTALTTYVTARYTGTYAKFDAQTTEDFDEDSVVNFDSDTTTNFGVLNSSVIVIPSDCQFAGGREFTVEDLDDEDVNILADDGEYEPQLEELVPEHLFTFPDKDAVISTGEDGTAFTLSDLAAGDIIYVEGTTWMFKIKTVTINNNGSISFTQDKDVTMTDFYDVLKVDMEGVEAERADPRLRLDIVDVDGTGSVGITLGPIKEIFSNGVELSGSISGKVTGHVKVLYDAHLFGEDYIEAEFTFTTELSGTVQAKVSTDNENEYKNVVFQVDTRKLRLPTPVTGLDIYIKPTAKIAWELEGDVSITWSSSQTSGFKYNSNAGRTDIKKKENTVSVMAHGSAEAKIGPVIDIGVELLGGVLEGGVTAEAGAKLTAEAEIPLNDDLTNTADSKHACGLCISARADWYASAYVKCGYKITDHFKGDIVKLQILDYTSPIKFGGFSGEFFVSVINTVDSPFGANLKMGGGECTNRTYRTEIKTQDKDGNDLRDIQVSVVRRGQPTNKTGTSPYVVYLYNGTYSASAAVGSANVSKSFTVNEAPQTLILSINTTDTKLEGTVVNANNPSIVIPGATVNVIQDGVEVASATTDSRGRFSVEVPNGSLTVEISMENFAPFSRNVTVYEGEPTHSMGQIGLTPASGMGGLRGVIRDSVSSAPLADVTLNLYEGWDNPAAPNTSIQTLKTNSSGEFRYETKTVLGVVISGLPSGRYTLTASKEGYLDARYNIVIYAGTTDENPAINEVMSPEKNEDIDDIIERLRTAKAGEVIKLNKDITGMMTNNLDIYGGSVGNPVVLDLNGHTLSITGELEGASYYFRIHGALQIRDRSGTDQGILDPVHPIGIDVQPSGYLLLDGGTIDVSSGSHDVNKGSSNVSIQGTCIMNGGTILGTAWIRDNATFTMNGGSIICGMQNLAGEEHAGSSVQLDDDATFTMNDGTLSGVVRVLDSSVLTIHNGTVTGKACYISGSATFTQNGGTVTIDTVSILDRGTYTQNGGTFTPGVFNIFESGVFNRNGGTFNGETTQY